MSFSRALTFAMLLASCSVAASWCHATTCVSSGKWMQIDTTQTLPDSLTDHTTIYDPVRHRMWVYGGETHTTDGSTDLIYLDTDNLEWHTTPVTTIGDSTYSPPAFPLGREGHSAVYDSRLDAMVIFGGGNEDNVPGYFLNDVWVLTFSDLKWKRYCDLNCAIAANLVRPGCRWYSVAVYDSTNDKMFVYGGDYGNPTYFKETWKYTFASPPLAPSSAWQKYDSTGLLSTNAMGVLDAANNRLVVFGGHEDGGVEDTTRSLNLGGSPSWTTHAGPRPSARYDAAYALDRRRNRFLVLGGWASDYSTMFSDVWAYDLTNGGWIQLLPTGTIPAGRREHTAIYDSKNDRVVIFGGKYSEKALRKDTWILDFNATPDSITDLLKDFRGLHSMGLVWTSPGNDGSTGTACEYDVRYSTSNITAGNFASASQATGEPAPTTAGSEQYMTVSGLNSNTTYYFAMKTKSTDGDWSGMSNVMSDHTNIGPGAATMEVTPARLSFAVAKGNPGSGSAVWQLAVPASLDRRPYTISIVSPAGHIVRTIAGIGEAGRADVVWNLTDDRGVRVGSGKYFARLEMGGELLQSSAVVLQ